MVVCLQVDSNQREHGCCWLFDRGSERNIVADLHYAVMSRSGKSSTVALGCQRMFPAAAGPVVHFANGKWILCDVDKAEDRVGVPAGPSTAADIGVPLSRNLPCSPV